MLRYGLKVLRSLTLHTACCGVAAWRSFAPDTTARPMLRDCLGVLRSLTLQHGLMLRCSLEVLCSPMLQHGLTLRRGRATSSNLLTTPRRTPLQCVRMSLQGGDSPFETQRYLQANATAQHNAAYWFSTTSRHNATARPDTTLGSLPRQAG